MFKRGLVTLYGWGLPRWYANKLEAQHYNPLSFLVWFWNTRDFSVHRPTPAHVRRLNAVTYAVRLGMAAQLALGIGFLIAWARYGSAGAWQFGVALIVSYPLVWVHLLALCASIGWLAFSVNHPKDAGRAVVCHILERQVRSLRHHHKFSVVAVAGSVGKTSTKLAIAELLAQTKRVRYQAGNYNDRVTVPLVFFGHNEPVLLNVVAWCKIFMANHRAIRAPFPYDVVVVELGTDGPGQMHHFAYIRPDIGVLTALTSEHMLFFKTMDAVATEELTIADYSKRLLINGDDTPGHYVAGRVFDGYSLTSEQAQYGASTVSKTATGQKVTVRLGSTKVTVHINYLGSQGLKVTLAAAAAANMLGVTAADIASGLATLRPFAGRMQPLAGVRGSHLIDDTYNASVVSVQAALDVLYATRAPQRIAILGSINELGDSGPDSHRAVGTYCDPSRLDLVVTIGTDAQKYLAPAAQAVGCNVNSFLSPFEAGEFVLKQLKPNALVLAKGSQNGVFAEEALKPLLADPTEANKLVRQSAYWQDQKAKQFPH